MATFVWTDGHGRGRNRYALFRRKLMLGEGASGVVRIFADTRYRLLVNGSTVAHGPARFFRSRPEYDEVDVTAWLRGGENVLAVVVNSVGAVHFQGELSAGALWLSGVVREPGGREHVLDTGHVAEGERGWVAIDSPGHVRATHALSFAVGPVELLDLSAMPAGWASPGFDDAAWPAAVERVGASYGPMRPRSIPMLDERAVVPMSMSGVFVGHTPEAEDVYGLSIVPEDRTRHGQASVAAAVTYVFSPLRQDVTFYGWWGRYLLGGRELTAAATDERRRRQAFHVTLSPGWTPLVCAERFPWSAWELVLRFPSARGIELSATRRPGSPELFRVLGPYLEGSAEAGDLWERVDRLHETLRPDEGWVWPRDRSPELPHRERADRVWGRVLESAPPGPLRFRGDDLPHGAESVAVVYDLGTEVLGRPRVRFAAPRGTRVDLVYAERLTDAGTADALRHPLVDPCERYIASGEGVETVHTFHPRGMRYLEVVLTPPAGATDAGVWDGVRVESVELTRARYPAVRSTDPTGNVGRFECSDPVLNHVWELGSRTLAACMEDAYLDCPLRERGLYVGDALVQFHINLVTWADTRLFRRCWELFFLSAAAGTSGLVAGGCFGLSPGTCPDYSSLMPWGLRAYYDATGDFDFLQQMRPPLERLLESLAALVGPDGLVDATGLGAYVDTATHDHDGVSAAVNAFVAGAFREAAAVFDRLRDVEAAAAWRGRYDALKAAFHAAFFDAGRRVYLDRQRGEAGESTPSVHGNTLALLFELAPAEHRPRVAAYLKSALESTAAVPRNGGRASAFPVSSYFSFYTLSALADAGEWPFVLEFIRQNWSPYLAAGNATAWEYFSDEASLCHAWSASPTYLLSRYALGVSFPVPGDLSRVRIEPETAGLAFAEGVVPHPGGVGPIWVSWERPDGGPVRLQVRLPRGVTRV